jgi:hypothetical protein
VFGEKSESNNYIPKGCSKKKLLVEIGKNMPGHPNKNAQFLAQCHFFKVHQSLKVALYRVSLILFCCSGNLKNGVTVLKQPITQMFKYTGCPIIHGSP